MRRTLAVAVTVVSILAVLSIAALAAGCGGSNQSAAPSQTAIDAPATAEGILTQAVTSSQSVSSATGAFNLAVNLKADAAKVPPEAQAFLGKPITIDGTFGFNNQPQAADVALNAGLAGQNLALGFRMLDNKAWIKFQEQWYEAPPELMQAMAAATTSTTGKPDGAGIMQALAAAAVDPKTWLTGLRIAGEETINGTPVYHLAGSLDVAKIAADAMKLMQDKTFMGMLPSIMGGGAGATTTSVSLPSQQELQALQTQMASVFKNLTVDIWIAKDTYQFRKVAFNAEMVPPPDDTSAEGITGVTVSAAASLDPSEKPLTVEPPADVKPASELEKALGGLEGLFSGALGGAMMGR
jgi:hypothetical protein